MHIEWVHNTEGKFIRLALPCESIRLFNRNYFIEWIKFVKEKDKKLVQKLPYRGGIALAVFWHVLTLNHFQIAFKKGICFNHTENFGFRRPLCVVAAPVVSTSTSLF